MTQVYTIRRRERLEASPKAGLCGQWTEWQVLQGRKIIARLGSQREAERFIAELEDAQ